MSKKLLKNGISENKLVNNLNAEMVGGLTKNELTPYLAYFYDKGYLVKFDLSPYSHINQYIIVHITGSPGNSDIIPINSILTFYKFNGTIIYSKLVNYGRILSDINIFEYNEELYIWFPSVNKHWSLYFTANTSVTTSAKKPGNIIKSITDSEMPENVQMLTVAKSYACVINNTGNAFDMLDFNTSTSTLEGLKLPPIENVGTIILRYGGVVDLNDYVNKSYSWLKIYVHNNFLNDYRKTYPKIANLLYPINKVAENGTGMLNMPSGVFIVYNSSPRYVSCVNLQNYNPSYNDVVQGILVVEGNNSIVVATKDSEACLWCSTQNIDGGGFTTTDMTRAQADLNGKLNTAFQILHEECQDPSCAVGFCASYGTDYWPAGNWWLPSLGEILLINSHIEQVNYALSLVGGDPLKNIHWSSTEANKNYAWYSGMSNMGQLCLYDDTTKFSTHEGINMNPKARPVTKLSSHTNSSYKSQGLPAMTMIDTTSSVLPDISNLPDIQTLDKIILRYDGVVKDVDTYMMSTPITLDELIAQGLIDPDTTAQDLVDMGIIEEEQLENVDSNSQDIEIPREKFSDLQNVINEKITAQNNSIAKANQSGSLKSKGLNDTNASFEVNNFEIMPLVNLDDYVKTPNNWLKIYVPQNQLYAYKEEYPTIKDYILPIAGPEGKEIGGRNLILNSKFGGYKDLENYHCHFKRNDETINVGDYITISAKIQTNDNIRAIGFTLNGSNAAVIDENNKFIIEPNKIGEDLYRLTGKLRNGGDVLDREGKHRIYIHIYPKDRESLTEYNIEWIKLERGKVATDWTPAPEDIETEITSLTESLTSTKKEFNNYISLEELKTIFPDKSEEIDELISAKNQTE